MQQKYMPYKVLCHDDSVKLESLINKAEEEGFKVTDFGITNSSFHQQRKK